MSDRDMFLLLRKTMRSYAVWVRDSRLRRKSGPGPFSWDVEIEPHALAQAVEWRDRSLRYANVGHG
jgi:hypothetical protein